MLDCFVDRILIHLVSEKYIDKADSDIYRFGLECLLLKLIHYFSYLMIGLLLRSLSSLLISICLFVPLRRKAGGYHSKTRIGCYIFSCSIVFLICISNKLQFSLWFYISGVVVSDIVICLWAPVDNENRSLYSEEAKKFRKQAIIILLFSNIFLFCVFIQNAIISKYLSNGIILAAALVFLGRRHSKGLFIGKGE